MNVVKQGDMLAKQAYSDCIRCLNTLHLGYQALEWTRKLEDPPPKPSSVEVTRRNLAKLGYSVEDVNDLRIIHVAGTKGKGSVCAYTESIIRAHGKKTGFFTSPHLREVRDRIRIHGQPISVHLFVKYFGEVWNKLSVNPDHELKYFSFLTLLSYHVFKQEGVDVCIYETGVGGQHDATNIVSKPVVTGITKLGIDHPKTLQNGPGPGRAFDSLIENIAWHKGGIMKAGTPAFSTIQEPEALKVLQDRALEKGISLDVVGINHSLITIVPGLDIEVQKYNASLAVCLANTYFTKPPAYISETVAVGIKQCTFEGRFQSLEIGPCRWHLDGAHNIESIKVAVEWFATILSKRSSILPRILIFNQQSEQRDGEALLRSLFDSLAGKSIKVDYAIFTTSEVWKDKVVIEDLVDNNKDPSAIQSLKLQKRYAGLWADLSPETSITMTSTVEEALDFAQEIGRVHGGMDAIITGSLHLIGSALHVIDKLIIQYRVALESLSPITEE